VARRTRVQGRQRRLRARARLDPARDLLRLPRRRHPGGIIGGLGFIVQAVVAILLLSLVFLAHSPRLWIRGAGAGAGAAVGAVAVQAARGLIGPSFARVRSDRARSACWVAYLAIGIAAATPTPG
jgi:chromate transporter